MDGGVKFFYIKLTKNEYKIYYKNSYTFVLKCKNLNISPQIYQFHSMSMEQFIVNK